MIGRLAHSPGWGARGVERAGGSPAPWVVFLVLVPFREGSGSPEGLLIAHLAFLVAAMVTMTAVARKAHRLDPRLLLPAAAALGTAMLSGAFGSYRFASILATVDLAVVLGVLVLVEASARNWPDRGEMMVSAIALSGFAQSALVLGGWVWNGLDHAAPGTLLNSDHAAAYLLLAFWALLARDREPSPAWIAAGTTILAAAVLLASRGALLGLAAGGVVFVGLRWRAMTHRTRVGVLAGSAAVLVLGSALLVHRFMTHDDPYRWDRLRLWGASMQVLHENPVFGTAPGVFQYWTAPFDVPRRDGPVRYGKHLEATHSDYLRVLVETGLAGFLAFLALGLTLAYAALAALRSGRHREAALGAAVAGLFAQMAVENLSARPAVSYTGAAVLALLLALGPERWGRKGGAERGEAPVASPESGSENGRGATAIGPRRSRGDEGDQDVRSFRSRAGDRSIDPDRQDSRGIERAGTIYHEPLHASAATRVRVALLYGAIASAAIVLVIAPYLGHRAFERFLAGGQGLGTSYAAAVFWNPVHPEYRAALARAVLAGKHSAPGDFEAGLLAAADAIALLPVEPSYRILKARLARKAFLSGPGEPDWIRLADEEYLRAEALDPLRPPARLERGWMLLGVGRASDALEEAGRTRDSEPNSFEARRLRAASLIELGRLDEAGKEMTEAHALHASVSSYVQAHNYQANEYEAAVLRWDEEGWNEVARHLGGKRR